MAMHNRASDTMGIPGGGTSHGTHGGVAIAKSDTLGLKGGTSSASKACGSHPAEKLGVGQHANPVSTKK